MLVVDFHTLSTVNVLNFVEQVLLNFFRAADPKNILRNERTANKSIPGLDHVARMNLQVFAVRDHVLNLSSVCSLHENDSLPTLLLGWELNFAVNLRNNRWILRLTNFKEFGHSRQTSSDVLSTR
jgi:hypothetical protein